MPDDPGSSFATVLPEGKYPPFHIRTLIETAPHLDYLDKLPLDKEDRRGNHRFASVCLSLCSKIFFLMSYHKRRYS